MNNTISNLDDWIYSHRICITRSCIVMTIVAVALAILGMGLQVNHSTMSISMASYMSGAIVQAWSFCGLLAIIRSKKTAIGEDEKTREARLKCFQSQHDVDAPSQKKPVEIPQPTEQPATPSNEEPRNLRQKYFVVVDNAGKPTDKPTSSNSLEEELADVRNIRKNQYAEHCQNQSMGEKIKTKFGLITRWHQFKKQTIAFLDVFRCQS